MNGCLPFNLSEILLINIFFPLIFSAALGRVCMKLVIVMGVTWTADVLSWIAEVLSWGNDGDYFWYATDLINALQGVLIFFVVGCQPQVMHSVHTEMEIATQIRPTKLIFLLIVDVVDSFSGFERTETHVGLQKWSMHTEHNARSATLELIKRDAISW